MFAIEVYCILFNRTCDCNTLTMFAIEVYCILFNRTCDCNTLTMFAIEVYCILFNRTCDCNTLTMFAIEVYCILFNRTCDCNTLTMFAIEVYCILFNRTCDCNTLTMFAIEVYCILFNRTCDCKTLTMFASSSILMTALCWYFSSTCKRRYVLYSAVSGPLVHSKRFTLQTCSFRHQLSGKHSVTQQLLRKDYSRISSHQCYQRNERIRGGMFKVREILTKVQERRLKWYGHEMRIEEHYVGRRAMGMGVQGRRRRVRRRRRWLDRVRNDITDNRGGSV